MKNETTKFSVSRAILAISNRIKHWALIIFPLCFFFISCNGSKKQSAGQEVNEVKLQTEDILFPRFGGFEFEVLLFVFLFS